MRGFMFFDLLNACLCRKLAAIFSMLAVLILSFSATGWAEQETATQPKAYFFEAKGRKELYIGQVYGSNCSNLKGNIDVGKRSVQGLWEALKWGFADGDLDLPIDDKIRQEYRKKAPVEFWLLCVPYVENITDYLEKGGEFDGQGSIKTTGGPVLFYNRHPEEQKAILEQVAIEENKKRPLPKGMLLWQRDMYWKIKSFSNCANHDNEFCAKIEFAKFKAENAPLEYSEENFRVLCWDCNKFKSSPELLQKAYVSRNAWLPSAIVFDGAFMTNEILFSLTPSPAVQYRTPEQYAAKEKYRKKLVLYWEELRELAEKEMKVNVKNDRN